MDFDFNLNAAIQAQLSQVAQKMQIWEVQTLLADTDAQAIASRIHFFNHTREVPTHLTYAGVDGSGDYPMLAYADSFVYLTVAHAVLYERQRHAPDGLRERRGGEPLSNVTWLPGDYPVTRREALAAFAQMTGEPLETTFEQSDYRHYNRKQARLSVADITEKLVIPQASDSGNHAIQLRTVGELSAALRLLQAPERPSHLLYDSTLALPLHTSSSTLFLEHLKRRVCVAAREAGTAFIAVSKSAGLPGMEEIERLAAQRAREQTAPQTDAVAEHGVAEHWYLRLPIPSLDAWKFPPAHGRTIPPPGAVTYLVRFHRTAPVLRLDLDEVYWRTHILAETDAHTRQRERTLLEQLDFASHDQRAYGYPYPLKAAHNHASLTGSERQTMRGQLIDAAVKAGMNRKLFRDASTQTGHR